MNHEIRPSSIELGPPFSIFIAYMIRSSVQEVSEGRLLMRLPFSSLEEKKVESGGKLVTRFATLDGGVARRVDFTIDWRLANVL